MGEDAEDILGRLDAALAALKTEFLAAQTGLTEQISFANDRLGNLVTLISQKTTAADENGDRRQLDLLRKALAEREQSGAAGQHAAELDKTVEDLKAEVALLRSQEAWLVAANQDLSERLVAVRAEGKATAKTLLDAEAAVERLKKTVDEYQQRLETTQEQRDQALNGRAEAPETVKRLSEEVTSLRYDNMRLRAGLENLEAKAEELERQQRIVLESMAPACRGCKIGELLVAAGIITREQLREALAEQQASAGRLVGSILIDKGLTGETEVAQAVACQLKLPFVRISEKTIPEGIARLVDEATCRTHQCIPVSATSDCVLLAMCNPRDERAIPAVQQASRRGVVRVVATPTDVAAAIKNVFGQR